jgi:CRISPR/Cas system-associated endonuclease Cas3-HD
MSKFIGTVADKYWIESLPKDMDLREKAIMLHDVKYIDIYDNHLFMKIAHEAQLHKVYLDEYIACTY